MITKQSFGELIISSLNGGDIPARDKYDIRDVFKATDMVIAQMIADLYRSRKGVDAYINGNFVKAFEDVPIKYNHKRKETYFELPAEMIALENDRGLRLVSFMEGQNIPFVIMANGSQNVWDILQVSAGKGTFNMYIEGPKVFIPAMPDHYGCYLLVKMICSTSSLEPDELLRIPAETEAMVFEQVLKMFGVMYKTPEKVSNISNPNVV